MIKELQNFSQVEWDRCSNWLQNALDASGNLATLDQVKYLVLTSRAKFWVGKECAFITEILQYPDKKVLNLWLAGGDLAELLSFEPEVREYAKTRDCEVMMIQGRPGWQKVFKKTSKWVCILDEV